MQWEATWEAAWEAGVPACVPSPPGRSAAVGVHGGDAIYVRGCYAMPGETK